MNKIIVDVDGVCLNWFGPFLVYAGMTKDEWFAYEKSNPFRARDLVHHFNESIYMRNLPSYSDDCIFGMRTLFEHGNYIKLLSACLPGTILDSMVIDARHDNLEKFFKHHTGVTYYRSTQFIGVGECKKHSLDKLANDGYSILIEDHLRHALSGVEVGLTTFLLDRSYNQFKGQEGEDEIIRVKNWKEILEQIGY